jgi:hypothetical protein
MVCAEFNQDEDGQISVLNDYRQFALIKNPTLENPFLRLRFAAAGLATSFTVDSTVTQGLTGATGGTGFEAASGTIVEWNKGATGTTGTSELVLKDVSGTFAIGGLCSTFEIVGIEEKTLAGSEGRVSRRLRLVPSGAATFNGSGTDFTPGYNAFGIGNTGDNITPSLGFSKIYSWEPEAGTNEFGNLYLENTSTNFTVGEHVAQVNNLYNFNNTAIGKIIEIGESFVAEATTYAQTTQMTVVYDGIEPFTSESFVPDTIVGGYDSGDEICTGYVVDWTPATGATTGTLTLLEWTKGFTSGLNVLYTDSSLTGGSITAIISSPAIVQNSGEIVHIQNIRPIERDIEQSEEIKFVVQF